MHIIINNEHTHQSNYWEVSGWSPRVIKERFTGDAGILEREMIQHCLIYFSMNITYLK